ncbi:MucBP domain-containing protein [Weissella coleopterorum]|uniref:MucBP domain-containing protein n=2 Tax=Weissella coleopterorum TaxID=2714949 RepID=A0A6G8B207_9LACO|nr:MucBP domain-containing protein [Weissella coleopterorum]
MPSNNDLRYYDYLALNDNPITDETMNVFKNKTFNRLSHLGLSGTEITNLDALEDIKITSNGRRLATIDLDDNHNIGDNFDHILVNLHNIGSWQISMNNDNINDIEGIQKLNPSRIGGGSKLQLNENHIITLEPLREHAPYFADFEFNNETKILPKKELTKNSFSQDSLIYDLDSYVEVHNGSLSNASGIWHKQNHQMFWSDIKPNTTNLISCWQEIVPELGINNDTPFNGKIIQPIIYKIKAAKVTAKYIDESGKEIAKSEVKSGNIEDTYKTEQKDIEGYTFKEVQGNESGKFTDKAQTVTYVYTKDPVKGADVTAKYVDESGKEIAQSEVKSGNIGDKYTTEKKDIKGYTFKEVEGSITGTLSDKAQTVTYIYVKNDDSENQTDPSEPAKPDTPDNSGDTDNPVNNNESNDADKTTDSNSTIKNVVNDVVEGAQTLLPKTAAEKLTLTGVLIAVVVSLAGIIILNKRK